MLTCNLMAEIATYQCNNYRCRYSVRVTRDFPLWHPNTPRTLRSFTVSPASHPYVIGSRSEIFCHNCRKVVEHVGTTICASCGASDLREEQAGKACAQCPAGTFEMTKLIVY